MVGPSEQTVEVNAQSMSSQFGIETSDQPQKGMSVVLLKVELFGQLPIHRFNDLPNAVEQSAKLIGHLLFLVLSG